MSRIATEAIQELVFRAIRNANEARTPDKQLSVDSGGAIFGPTSPLDSLGLVALLIDIEEAFADQGIEITLSDERAMSQRHSPFQTVGTLVSHIQSLLDTQG
jgi:acyl carrier protein